MTGSHHRETRISDSGVAVRRLRVGVVGLSHYHVTGWVETLETLDDLLEIVALYDPDPERGRTLGPPHRDPTLRADLGERYRDLPFETQLDDLIARHALDLALVIFSGFEGGSVQDRAMCWPLLGALMRTEGRKL